MLSMILILIFSLYIPWNGDPSGSEQIGCMADVHLLGYGMKVPQIKLSSSFLCLDKAVFTFLCSTFLSEEISFYLI